MNIKELMDELIALYSRQFATQKAVDAWGAQYRSVLGHLEPQDMRRTFQDTMADHRYQRAPLPAEFADHIPEKHYTHEPTKRPDEEKWADKVMTLPEGQDALCEGYARELYRWAEANPGTIPPADVLEACRRSTLEFNATFRKSQEQAKVQDRKDQSGTLAMAATLRAGAQMVMFENWLKKRFLQAVAA